MSVYTGILNGSVQSGVYDQPGTALNGQLYGAPESSLIDAYAVAETNGIGAGIGITIGAVTDPRFPGINDSTISLPTSAAIAANFGGIVVRNQAMQSDSNGNVYVGNKRMANVIRPLRAGGRIWVIGNNNNDAKGTVYWIVQDTAGHGFPIGSFSGSALGAAGIDTVALTNATFASAGSAGKPVVIELG